MELLKFVIVGHVDHGKSTLIGRLLHDTGSVPEDKISDIRVKCKRLGKDFEYAFLLDALEEEQEQTITIDTTQINFKSKKRNYLIIDAPGHKEFLKNMITGASNADAAILLVDAKEGIREQTRRHAYILSLLGTEKIIVAVNKMDAVGYSETIFTKLREQMEILLSRFNLTASDTIPISARSGDNILSKSEKMTWYKGSTIVDSLDNLQLTSDEKQYLRYPVQDIYKWDERIIVGRIESGSISEGDMIALYPSSRKTTVKSILKWGAKPKQAMAGDSIGIVLDDPLFVERGEIAARPENPPNVSQEIRANIFWMVAKPLEIKKSYTLKLLTSEIQCEVLLIKKRIDSSSVDIIQENASQLLNTEVGEIVLHLEKPIAVDDFSTMRKSGRFVLIDRKEVSGGGIIIKSLENTDGSYTS